MLEETIIETSAVKEPNSASQPTNQQQETTSSIEKEAKITKRIILNIGGTAKEVEEGVTKAQSIVKTLNKLKSWDIKTKAKLQEKIANGLSISEVESLLEQVRYIEELYTSIRSGYTESTIDINDEKVVKNPQEDEGLENPIVISINDKATLDLFTDGDFHSTLVHDARTPITSIKGFLQLIQLRPENSKKHTPIVVAQFGKTDEIINGQVQALIPELKNEKSDIGIHDIKEACSESITIPLANAIGITGETKLSLNINIPNELLSQVVIEWSIRRINQTFFNIVDNSIKEFTASAIKNPSFSLTLSLSEDGKSLVIHLDDNGRGYPKEYIEKGIIEASNAGRHDYEVAPGGQKVQSKGTGLADYAKKIRNSYHGDMRADYVRDNNGNIINGARTTITVPLKTPVSLKPVTEEMSTKV